MKISQLLAAKEMAAGVDDPVVTVSPDDLVVTVLSLLAQHRIGAIVATRDGSHIDGIVSERDIVRAMAADPDAGTTGGVRPRSVASIMSAPVVTIGIDGDIDEAMAIMTNSRIRHLPVVDSDELLVGLVSIGDVVKAKLSALEEEKSALMDYVNRGG
jgi:CBS domain-containing protein